MYGDARAGLSPRHRVVRYYLLHRRRGDDLRVGPLPIASGDYGGHHGGGVCENVLSSRRERGEFISRREVFRRFNVNFRRFGYDIGRVSYRFTGVGVGRVDAGVVRHRHREFNDQRWGYV